MRGVIAEAEYRGDVILFFDELHTVIGAGAAEGAVDASNILKQPLGRGDITVIGATTYGEYEKYVENDPALSRRFQPVFINEPDDKLAFSMLCGVRPEFERHHNVKITDGALSEAVRLSKKYIKNRALPDKAIDLIDEAAAGARGCVTEDDIKKTLSVMSCGAEDITALKDLRARLEQTVFGQSAAIKAISGALIKSFSFLSDGLGPKASFLFKGPESVGKTAVCRALADILYPGKNAFFRFDMSEYTEPHSVSRLIGAPPGYSGCHDGGSLTECVRRHPCSVICVSDIEYAHGDVLSLFAEILDKGELTDSRGRTVDFSGAVIIFTSICGGGKASGFCRGDDAVPEKSPLDGRVCRVVNFSPLCAADLQKIIERRLSRLKELCRVPLTVDENSAAALALKCAGKNARAALEAVGEFIEEPLSAMLLEPGVIGADIKTNGKDITVSSVKTLDKPLVMEYN
jgi:ATP-dependent Clp protease ATP-binding subunit ClpC